MMRNRRGTRPGQAARNVVAILLTTSALFCTPLVRSAEATEADEPAAPVSDAATAPASDLEAPDDEDSEAQSAAGRASARPVFKPSEEISEDLSVSFPSDI